MGERALGLVCLAVLVWYVPEELRDGRRPSVVSPRPRYRTALLGACGRRRDPFKFGVEAANHVCDVNGEGLRRSGLSESKRRACGWAGRNGARLGKLSSDQHADKALTGKSRERSALQVPERCQSAISSPAPHRKTVGFSGKRSRGRPAWPDRVVSMGKGMVRLNRRSANVTVPCKPLTHIAGKTVRAPFFFLSQFCLAQPQTGSLTG